MINKPQGKTITFAVCSIILALIGFIIFRSIKAHYEPEPYHIQAFVELEGELFTDDRASTHFQEYMRQEHRLGYKLVAVKETIEGRRYKLHVITKKKW